MARRRNTREVILQFNGPDIRFRHPVEVPSCCRDHVGLAGNDRKLSALGETCALKPEAEPPEVVILTLFQRIPRPRSHCLYQLGLIHGDAVVNDRDPRLLYEGLRQNLHLRRTCRDGVVYYVGHRRLQRIAEVPHAFYKRCSVRRSVSLSLVRNSSVVIVFQNLLFPTKIKYFRPKRKCCRCLPSFQWKHRMVRS